MSSAIRFKEGWMAAAVAAVLAAGAMAAERPAPETPPAAPSTDAASPQVRRLIEQLGDKDYFVRQQAEEQLAKLGFEAFDALCDAAVSGDLEVAARARRLLALMKVYWADKNDPAEVKQILRDYELQNVDGRQAAMVALAGLPGGAGTGALCRLVRYEKSAMLSKYAAVLLLGDPKTAAPPKKALADVLIAKLAGSRRPAAAWLLTWARSAADPRAMADQWNRLVEAEQTVWQGAPAESGPEILVALRRVQVAWLRKLGRTDDMLAAVQRLMQIGKGDTETLGSLLEWLIEQKDWKNMDRLAEQFAAQIAHDANLLYCLAEARADRGDAAQAEQLAAAALALFPGKAPQDPQRHLMAAFRLQRRGRFAWAKREYRHVIASGVPTGNETLLAQRQLAEMLHDQAEDQEAGEVLQQMVQAVGVNRPAEAQVLRENLGAIRARMNYFFASQAETKGDRAGQRDFLDKALAEDASDIEVLIACYRIPDTAAAYREKIRKLISAAVAGLREKIDEDPENPANDNELAWLVGNTEGDLDEALRASQKSLELSPDSGGYYDTLARVYYAKGDFENAVKNQTKATELDPHSGQITRQLAVYRKALAEKKAKK